MRRRELPAREEFVTAECRQIETGGAGAFSGKKRPVVDSFNYPSIYVKPSTGVSQGRVIRAAIQIRAAKDGWTDLDEFLFGSNERPKSFGEQSCVEWLLKRFIDTGPIEADRTTIIRKQSDQDRLREIAITLQVLANL